MNIDDLIQEVVEATESLSKYVKTHRAVQTDFEMLDELSNSVSDLQETLYELEARVPVEDKEFDSYDEA
jgi:hypothetical protein